MARYAIEFFSGYLEEVLSTVGSRDVTLVERFLRLGEHTRRVLGLGAEMMAGWEQAVECLLMEPPKSLDNRAQSVAMATLLQDAGQRRFRVDIDEHDEERMEEILDYLGHREFAADLLDSAIRPGLRSASKLLRWGFLDVNQVETLLLSAFGDDSFKEAKTAAIAGRLSNHARGDAEKALLEVGVETQNSVSHNIDYLIIGSKGTGGTKHDKVQALVEKGHKIEVLDEDGFERLIHSPKPPKPGWDERTVEVFEDFISALRHVWAFDLDLYTISYYSEGDQY